MFFRCCENHKLLWHVHIVNYDGVILPGECMRKENIRYFIENNNAAINYEISEVFLNMTHLKSRLDQTDLPCYFQVLLTREEMEDVLERKDYKKFILAIDKVSCDPEYAQTPQGIAQNLQGYIDNFNQYTLPHYKAEIQGIRRYCVIL